MTHKNKGNSFIMFFSYYVLLLSCDAGTRGGLFHSLTASSAECYKVIRVSSFKIWYFLYVSMVYTVYAYILVYYTNMYTTNSGQGITLPASPRREALAPKIGVWFGGDEEVLNPTSIAKS